MSASAHEVNGKSAEKKQHTTSGARATAPGEATLSSRPEPIADLMAKLLRLTDSADGRVTKSQVEDEFAVKFPAPLKIKNDHQNRNARGGWWYYVHPNGDSHLNLGLAEGPGKYSWFIFSFDAEIESMEFGKYKKSPSPCITDEIFFPVLERQGWRRTETYDYGVEGVWLGRFRYKKGNLGRLDLVVSPSPLPSLHPSSDKPSSGHCLEELTMEREREGRE
ncbi:MULTISPECIES: hypothetical protein [Ralstonia]|jgi:hypothetical protein|nr:MULTISPECIES: hypothetical protein [Ralstonia]MBL4778591.1 hypothetical protein [Ralstonia sp.]MDR9385239.1 hypothetical protein [Ralstonia sp. 11b]